MFLEEMKESRGTAWVEGLHLYLVCEFRTLGSNGCEGKYRGHMLCRGVSVEFIVFPVSVLVPWAHFMPARPQLDCIT
jgi:hypothetical protein